MTADLFFQESKFIIQAAQQIVLILQMWIPVVRRNWNVQLLHQKVHNVITPAVDFQYRQIIFWCPLK